MRCSSGAGLRVSLSLSVNLRSSVNSVSGSVLKCATVSEFTHTHLYTHRDGMADNDWDTVTVLRKKGPSASQSKSRQVSPDNLDHNRAEVRLLN